MNHLHLCKLHDYVNYSNILIKETVRSPAILSKDRTGWLELSAVEVIWGSYQGRERSRRRDCKDLDTIG